MNDRAAREIETLLGTVPERDRRRLVAAMDVIRATLGDGPPPSVSLGGAQPGDLGWILERHGAVYAREYGWDQSLEAFIGKILVDYARPNTIRSVRHYGSRRPAGRVSAP